MVWAYAAVWRNHPRDVLVIRVYLVSVGTIKKSFGTMKTTNCLCGRGFGSHNPSRRPGCQGPRPLPPQPNLPTVSVYAHNLGSPLRLPPPPPPTTTTGAADTERVDGQPTYKISPISPISKKARFAPLGFPMRCSSPTAAPTADMQDLRVVWLAVAMVAGSAAAKRPRFTGTFPWQRVPTMCQTGFAGRFVRSNMTGTGRHDDAVVRFLAENYDLIVAGDTQPGTSGCLEAKVKEFADRVASFNPHARVLVCKNLDAIQSTDQCNPILCERHVFRPCRGLPDLDTAVHSNPHMSNSLAPRRLSSNRAPPTRHPSAPCARLGHSLVLSLRSLSLPPC